MAKIFYDKKELRGSLYIEIQPGKFKGEHWSEKSIFLDEEAFGYLLPAIDKAYKDFDYYRYNNINSSVWNVILMELQKTNVALKNNLTEDEIEKYITFIEESMDTVFKEDFNENLKRAIQIIDDFQVWMGTQLKEHSHVAILGI